MLKQHHSHKRVLTFKLKVKLEKMPMVRVELTWVAPVDFESTASTISPHRQVVQLAYLRHKGVSSPYARYGQLNHLR
jgi:hypothetical protein